MAGPNVTVQPDDVERSLLALLAEAFEGSRGQPTNFVDDEPNRGLLGIVEGVSAADASQKPLAGEHTIAAHIAHLSFGFDTTIRWLNGERWKIDWNESWQMDQVGEEQWHQLRDTLRSRYIQMSELIRATHAWNSENLCGIAGQIAHAAYHLGAIRQIAREIRSDSRIA